MTDQTEPAERLEGIRRALAFAATDRPTPEQIAEWEEADKATAQRIRAVLPGVPLHHTYAVLQALRVRQGLDAAAAVPAGQAPATDRAELMRAHVALAEQAGRDQAAIARVLEFAASLDEIGRNLAGPEAVHPVAARIRHLLDTTAADAVLPAPADRAATEERAARWETAALKAGREVDRNALRVYMAVADDEQAELRRLADEAQQPSADPSWPRRAWDLGLLHKGGDPHHCPACVAQPEPPKDFICPGAEANAEVLANPQPAVEAQQPATQADCNSGVGWYEVGHPRNATTCIAYAHEDGSLYLPEGDDLTPDEFAFAAARGNAHRLVRADEAQQPKEA